MVEDSSSITFSDHDLFAIIVSQKPDPVQFP
jgi:hypothetical protein